MTIIGFVGQPRTGKTLFMVWHAYNTMLFGAEILSNVILKDPFKWKFMSPYDMLKIPFTNVDRDKKTLLIQEADKWFNSRRSMRNENVLLGSLTGQTGKRNLNIFWDTQFPHLVDNQLRNVTEIVYHASVFVDSKTREPLAFQFTREEPNNQPQILPPIPASFFKPFYDMYDTYQPVTPMTVSKTMKQLSEMYE